MTTLEEKINNFNNPDDHDSAKGVSQKINYENNKAENLAGNTGGKVDTILKKNNFISRVKEIYNKSVKENKELFGKVENGIKNDINNIVSGFKNGFSPEKKQRKINIKDTMKELNIDSDKKFAEYEKYMLNYIEEGSKKWDDESAWKKERERAMSELEAVAKEYKLQVENENYKLAA